MSNSPESSGRHRRYISAARGMGIFVVAVGVLVLLGWSFDLVVLKSVMSGYATMKPLTAICFALCGISLVSLSRDAAPVTNAIARFARIAPAAVAAAIALTTFLEYALAWDAGIEHILFYRALTLAQATHPGRMAPATAVALLFISLALMSLDAEMPRLRRLSRALALMTLLTGLVAILGYLYGVETLYRISPYVSMALHTAVLLFALGAGTLISRPARGFLDVITGDLPGGWMSRRLLPAVVVAPVVIGWVRLKGQRAGFYGTEFGLALFATANILIIGIVICLGARSLNRLEKHRRRADEAAVQSAAQLAETTDRLSTSEERFRLFMSFLPAIAFLKDGQGRYLWGNLAWRRQFPDSWGDLTGKVDADLWPRDAVEVFALSDARVLKDEAPIQVLESGKVGAERRHWLVTKFRVPGPAGAILIGGVIFDTTENTRLEAQLHQAQKLEAIGLLAGGVAHDFNNLLTVILGYADLGMIAIEAGQQPVRGLSEIRKAGLLAADLTKQLLAFGRRQIMESRLIDVNAELTGMREMLHRVIRENVQVNFLLAPDTGSVNTDPAQIQQVILNLVMNAQDAMPLGGRLTIETANIELDASYAASHPDLKPGPYVMLAVSDSGVGIDEATLDHVFEPFFTTKEVGKGTGLGLATVYGIVKQSGGHIWVSSEPGLGTAFRIYLPRAQGGPAGNVARTPAEPPHRAQQASETLLIVEDNRGVRDLMIAACRGAGYEILSANNGAEALILIDSHPHTIDLIVADVVMPGMSGSALADRLAKRRPGTQVLFCSGYAENAILPHGVLGADVEFLPKPFTSEVLLHRIRSLLDRR